MDLRAGWLIAPRDPHLGAVAGHDPRHGDHRKLILLPLGGYQTSEEAAQAGGGMWPWGRDAPARIDIRRPDGDGSDLRWFTGPKTCQLHTFNAWEDGERIMLDAPFHWGTHSPSCRAQTDFRGRRETARLTCADCTSICERAAAHRARSGCSRMRSANSETSIRASWGRVIATASARWN